MDIDALPKGPFTKALSFRHFPTPAHAVIWRNWGLVPPARLAKTLAASEEDIARLVRELGLPADPTVPPEWLERGTNTLIRNNWHLLPYAQLLTLLDWTPERLDFVLREEDYLWVKLGHVKPDAAMVCVEPSTENSLRAAEQFRADAAEMLSALASPPTTMPFSFLRDYQTAAIPVSPAAENQAHTDRGFGLQLAYSYIAPYGDVFLHPELDPYPDGLLARYRDAGINAVWLPAILYTLVPMPGEREEGGGGVSEHWQTRRDNLARLAERIRSRGLELILYLNEPHGIPSASPLWQHHPDWRGLDYGESGITSFCTTGTGILDWTRDATTAVFRAAPALGGFFTINMSEFPTHCHSRLRGKECPRCQHRPVEKIVAESVKAVVEGARAANPNAKTIVWTWGWEPAWELNAVDLLPKDVTLQCVSEWGLTFTQAGISSEVKDYSLSKVGPSERSKALWSRAKARGLRTMAKVQLNTTWEMPAVPYLPVPTLADEHLSNLQQAGVCDLMISWTVGGYPGGNVALLNRSLADWAEELVDGDTQAKQLLLDAWHAMSEAFRHFPFSVNSLYFGPHSIGPANLLWPEPTGYHASMVQGFAYDDLESWRDCFTQEAYAAEWREVADGWKHGLALFDQIPISKYPQLTAMRRYVEVAYTHFRSVVNQVEFIRLRDALISGDTTARQRVAEILNDEITLARRLFECLRADSLVAFESANHYAYTANDLAEKIVQCRWLARQYHLKITV